MTAEPARRGKLGFPSKSRILPSVMAEQRGFLRWMPRPMRFPQTGGTGTYPPLVALGTGRETPSLAHRNRPRIVVMAGDVEGFHRETVDR